MALIERLLLGPGPANPYPEAREAIGRPMLGHLDPIFLDVLDETCSRLRTVFRTENELTLPVSGTGSAGMEACLVNLLAPGDVVVVGVNGYFGERLCEVAARCGAQVVAVRAPWGQPLDPEQVLAAHPAPKVIALVHAETSTGVRNDLGGLARLKAELGGAIDEALLVADCVTSLGGMAVEIDQWRVDAAYSCTQKCLGVAPGLSPVTLSPRALEARVAVPQSWYLDLGLIGDYAASKARRYHHTAPVSMIISLHAGLGALLEEGIEESFARHARCGGLLRDGLLELGLELFVAEPHRLDQITTVFVPDGVDSVKLRSELLARYNIEIGAGIGEWASKLWRIGTLGHGAREENVTLLLAALAELLRR
jgi:aspartate aminotransferase-like enzyme